MRFRLFCHSIESDWNHGNAHFLRGVCDELIGRGHPVEVFEPLDSWSRRNLISEQGPGSIAEFRRAYPRLRSVLYEPSELDADRALDGADVVLVHEWNDPGMVRRLGESRRRRRARGDSGLLFFHDTHHRAITDPGFDPGAMLDGYDGVLAFGRCLAEVYRDNDWAERVWVWHEAADVRRFRPLEAPREGDLVWIGNWGDEERTEELEEYLLGPVQKLGLRTRVHGVRYPPEARMRLEEAGARYAGWLPNHRVPEVFGRFATTMHVPRRPYARALPGIPTIRVFEALACGIPLICAPWEDAEGLFSPGCDYLVARDGAQVTEYLEALLSVPDLARGYSERGLRTIRERHTCGHRVDELLEICVGLGLEDVRVDDRVDDGAEEALAAAVPPPAAPEALGPRRLGEAG